MSAVPKRKLCWNCEGNIAKEINNCPYCGVYLNPPEAEDDTTWNPSYNRPAKKTEEVLSPLYQIQPQSVQEPEEQDESSETADSQTNTFHILFEHLKRDIFPILFLMMGSVFFLFGIVLLLFSQNGTLILQWKESHGFFFLLFAFPLIGFGWMFLQQLGAEHK